MRDRQTNEQLKIELLSQWKLEAKFRNSGRKIEMQKLVQYSRLVKLMHKEKK